jgi:hypothetical protein
MNMGKRTGIIKFNVTDRGRKFRGQNRNFDTARLAEIVNGGAVQERVKHGDMLGYYGHWPRVQFGMNPIEGAVVKGKAISLEPAVKTVYLKAYPDGTIEHEAEFLPTEAGKIAERLFDGRTGGFSSAIDVRKAGDKQLPLDFYGFDYVLEPNYTKNRGYEMALDGVSDDEMAVLDEVAAYNELIHTTNAVLDSMQAAYDRQAETLLRMEEEREQLYSMLLKATGQKHVTLDSLVAVVHGNRESRFDVADEFKNISLTGRVEPKDEAQEETAADRHISRRFNI